MIKNQGKQQYAERALSLLHEPNDELIACYWKHFPIPYEISMEDPEAVREHIKALFDRVLKQMKPPPEKADKAKRQPSD